LCQVFENLRFGSFVVLIGKVHLFSKRFGLLSRLGFGKKQSHG
jgi:hypothetical protein